MNIMDKRTEKSRKTYNKKAGDYKNTRDYIVTKKLKDGFVEYLSGQNIDGKAVLDIACGIGDLLNELCEKHSIRGTGVDVAENMVREAERLYGDRLKFVNANAEKIPVKNGTQDAVTICSAFHHISNPREVLAEVSRVLRNGGCFYIADYAFPAVLNKICNLVYPLLSSGDVRAYDKKDLEKLCAGAGFVVESYYRVGAVSYIAKLRKI